MGRPLVTKVAGSETTGSTLEPGSYLPAGVGGGGAPVTSTLGPYFSTMAESISGTDFFSAASWFRVAFISLDPWSRAQVHFPRVSEQSPHRQLYRSATMAALAESRTGEPGTRTSEAGLAAETGATEDPENLPTRK